MNEKFYLGMGQIREKVDFGDDDAGALGAAVAVGTLQSVGKNPKVGWMGENRPNEPELNEKLLP